MITDIIFLIFSFVFLLIGIKCKYKILLIFSTMSVLFSISSILIRTIFALQYFSYFRVAVYLILLVLIVGSFSLYTSKIIGVILTIVILIMSCLAFYIYESLIGVVFKNIENVDYVGYYFDFIVGSFDVTYYERKGPIIIADKYSFVDTYYYGIYDGFFDYEPDERNLNENS